MRDISESPIFNKKLPPDHTQMGFGERLRFYRHQNHMTQQELAKRVGVSTVTISKYERGITMPKDIYIVWKICRALNIKPSILLEEETELDLVIKTDYEREESLYLTWSEKLIRKIMPAENKYICLSSRANIPDFILE